MRFSNIYIVLNVFICCFIHDEGALPLSWKLINQVYLL